MFHGRNCGKKLKACLIVQQTFELVHLQTDKNPLGVFIMAVKTGGPREDSQRIGKGGSVKRQAVDVSPMRRVCKSLYLMCVGARKSAMRTAKSMAECLADEIVACAKNDGNASYTIQKKIECEKNAKANR